MVRNFHKDLCTGVFSLAFMVWTLLEKPA